MKYPGRQADLEAAGRLAEELVQDETLALAGSPADRDDGHGGGDGLENLARLAADAECLGGLVILDKLDGFGGCGDRGALHGFYFARDVATLLRYGFPLLIGHKYELVLKNRA